MASKPTDLDRKIAKNLNLDLVRRIQKDNRVVHVAGSAGLFLHGIRLNRWEDEQSSDIDLVTPYWVLIDDVNKCYDKNSGNDFDETLETKHGIKIDLLVDPTQKYDLVTYDGFTYKVSILEKIMEAKIKYALNGQDKHVKDVKEILSYATLGKFSVIYTVAEDDDDFPF